MKFSIIVPVYHVEEELPRCVESLRNQTYGDLEIILVDDGSNDRCPQMCDHYAQIDNRIRVIHKTNGGLSDARNAGTAIAQGDYILYVDSDDFIETNTCEKLKPFTEENPDIITGCAVVTGGRKNLEHIALSEPVDGFAYLREELKKGSIAMAVWLNAYKNSFLKENELTFKKGILHEDEDFTPRAFLKAGKIVSTRLFFYHYVIRENSITTNPDRRKNACDLYDTFVSLERLYEEINDRQLRNLLKNTLSEKYLSLFQIGKLYQYGENYLHKSFVFKNAFTLKTKIKAFLYILSPRLYWKLNNQIKKSK